MKKNPNVISSQQSPQYVCKSEYKHRESFYASMFIEDFCQSFSISFSMNNESREFFTVNSKDYKLEKFLGYEDDNFLKYAFDQQLQEIMHTLICEGKAYIEVVLLKDERGKLLSMSFVPLVILKDIKHKETTSFCARRSDNEKVRYVISNNNLIVF